MAEKRIRIVLESDVDQTSSELDELNKKPRLGLSVSDG